MKPVHVKNNIFHIGLTAYSFLKEDMGATSKGLILYRIINLIILMVTCVFVIATFFKNNRTTYVRIMESTLAILHIFLKYILLILNKSNTQRLLEETIIISKSIRGLNEDVILKDKRIYKIVRLFQIILLVAASGSDILFMLRPLVYEDHPYILDSFTFTDSIIVNTLVLAGQYYIFLLTVPIVIGYDIFYLTFCVYIIMEIRHLKHILKNALVKRNCITTNLIFCVKQHQLLIAMFARMRDMYSMTLLFHYFVTLIASCIDLYELMGRPGKSYNVAQILNVCVLFSEFSYYTFPAEQVSQEFADLTNTVYTMKWYDENIQIQRLILFILMRTQQIEYFTGGGILDINVNTFGSVVRKAFSFYAILRNVFSA